MSSKKIPFEQLVALLQMGITRKWPNDQIRPGLVLSYLGETVTDQSGWAGVNPPSGELYRGQGFYASVVRYSRDGSKQVMYKATAATAEQAVLDLARQLCDVNDPLEKLREVIR